MAKVLGLGLACALVLLALGCSKPTSGLLMDATRPTTPGKPSDAQITLALQQTESKGLKASSSVDLPDPTAPSVGTEVIASFKDGKVRDIVGAKKLRDMAVPGTAVYAAEGGFSIQNLETWRKDAGIAYVEPNYKLKISAADGPDDPKQDDVWGYYTVRTHKLWLAGYKAKENVKVAIVDTGVDYDHEDLKGIVEKGANVVEKNRDPMDRHGHGTHCAGVVGAIEGNGKGIAGVGAGVKLYAVKALNDGGEGPEEDIANGVMDAVNHGCKVINMSLGGPLDVLALHDAIKEAKRRGVLVVAAAGNNGDTEDNFPAAYPEALAVGATMPDDQRAFFSNYGNFTDIAAPGVFILSTLLDDAYDYLSGTSMAAPHVAGAAGLLWSRHPELTVDQVRALLVDTGDAAQGFGTGVKRMNIRNAFEKLEGKKIGPPDYNGGPAPVTPGPVNPGPGPAPIAPTPPPPITEWYRAIAASYGILATQDNVDAFLTEVRGFEKNGTLGPQSNQPAAVRDLQRALTKFGQAVPVTGNFDEATGKAVIAYKKGHNLHQTYKVTDGGWAVNEYVDPGTFNMMMAHLFSAVVAAI